MKIYGYLRLLAAAIVGTLALVASEQHGVVTLGGLPVPGVTVTATQGERKVTAVTDGMGTYSFPDLNDGVWTVQVEMSGFTPLKQDVTVGPNAEGSKFELKIKSLSEIQAEVQAAPPPEQRTAPAAAANTARPVPVGAKGQAQAQAVGRGGTPAAPTQAVAEAPAADDASSRAADGFLVNGSQVNGGASPFALNPAFGNNRRGPRSLYTYQLSFTLDNSATDAKPFSLTGLDQPKPAYNNYQVNGLIAGPLKIPHILRNGPNFTVQYSIVRNRNDSIATGLFPTQAERSGDLSALSGQITDPNPTGPAFTNNQIPQALISPQATKLLKLYPIPNVSGSSVYNYQTPLVGLSHSDVFNSRMNKQIGRKNSIQGLFALTSTRSTAPSVFGFLDTTSVLGMRLDPVWRHQFTPRMSTTLELNFTRNAPHQYSFFSNTPSLSGAAFGITGNDQNPLYSGPPTLNLGASNLSGLTDGSPSFNRQTFEDLITASTWNHGRHNVQFGGDVLWQQFNYNSQNNARGQFSFTGAATNAPGTPAGSFADFLLGTPDNATLAYGNPDKYLRARNYQLYVTDDWRVNSALTLNLNLRYEYNAPDSEEYGRLVNLDELPGFTQVAPVLGCSYAECINSVVPGFQVAPMPGNGPLTNMGYPSSLIRPERLPLEPSLGFAWRPISGSSLVVRGGYAMRFANPGYSGIAASMDQQYPFSTSINAINSPATPLTLANGFVGNPLVSAQTFGIDPNFRESYVQSWQLQLTKDLPGGMQTVITYQGVKGTRLPQFFYPNSYVTAAAPCPTCTSGFVYETSNADSTREAGSVQLRRRLHNGFTASVLYTYAKAIDDTNTQGQPAQNWLDLSAERGLSNFDQRQNAQFQFQYTSGMGIGGGSLISGWKAAALKEWTFLTAPQWGTGLPETPIYPVPLGGTTNGVQRPDYTGQPLYTAAPGLFLNKYAYAAPAEGTFGNAGVDTITGPQQFSLNGSLQRTFRINDRVTFNFRGDVSNLLNHVVFTGYNTRIGPQFGAATAANNMRSVRITGQFRF